MAGPYDVPNIAGTQEQEREYHIRKILEVYPERSEDPNLLYGNPKLEYLRLINEGLLSDGISTPALFQFLPSDNPDRLIGIGEGRTLYFGPGEYNFSRPITVPSNSTVKVDDKATLKWHGTGALFVASGKEIGNKMPISENAVKGTYTVNSPNHGLSTGDMFRLGSKELFDSFSTIQTNGEILFVDSVSGNTITTTSPVAHTYAVADSAYVRKISPVRNITFTGAGTIEGDKIAAKGQYGIHIVLGVNIKIETITTKNIDRRHIYLSDCINAWAFRTTHEWAVDNTQAYGMSFANACQDSGALFCNFTGIRHSFTTNNETSVDGIPRRIRFAFNTVNSSSTALGGSMQGGDAIDTHTAAEDIWFEYNTVNGSHGQGINFECRSGRIIGNVIQNTSHNGISVHNESDYNGDIVVSGNEVINAGSYGIMVRTGARGTTAVYDSIVVNSNVVRNAVSYGIMIGVIAPIRKERLASVVGNTIIDNKGSYALYVKGIETITHAANSFVGNTTSYVEEAMADPNASSEGYLAVTVVNSSVTITPKARFVVLTPENNEALGTLSTINGGSKGQVITLKTSSNSRDVNIPAASGNIRIPSIFLLDSSRDSITLGYDGTYWLEQSRTDYPAA